ncbi:MAG: transporter substrate-binding domain-containing protein [Synergistaceae bacterium]|nr:transporter substrate-binding domain-containing protein [Synergistaceae bacterium]
MKTKIKSAFVLIVAVLLSSVSLPVLAANVSSVEGLKSARVGVQSETVSETLIKDLLKGSSGEVVSFRSVFEVIDALKARKIDAAVMDESPARYFALTETETLRILPEPVEREYYAIAFRKGDELREKVDKALAEIKAEGTLLNIIAKYVASEPEPEYIDFNVGEDRPKLWVGCAASFPPYEMRDSRGFYGIDIELCAEIAKKLGMELVIADYRFEALPDALLEGKIDMICSAVTVTDARKEFLDFSEPYEANQQVIVVLK